MIIDYDSVLNYKKLLSKISGIKENFIDIDEEGNFKIENLNEIDRSRIINRLKCREDFKDVDMATEGLDMDNFEGVGRPLELFTVKGSIVFKENKFNLDESLFTTDSLYVK